MAGGPSLETVLHSTLQKSRKKLMMASIKSNAGMAWAFANDRVEFEDGGRHITNPLITGRNPNVGSYRYYDKLPVNQTDEFDTVEYFWSRVAGTVIISDQEQDENKGESAIFKLLENKMKVLEESMQEKFSDYFYGLGAGTDPYGLPAVIPDDPTTGVFGGIDQGSEQQWRTSAYHFAGSISPVNIEETLDDVLLIDLNLKKERPDVMITGRDWFRNYRAAVRDKVVINLSGSPGGKKMMDLGFEGVQHLKVPMLYDEDCPSDTMYMINSKYLRYHILRHANFKVKQLKAPWDVDAIGRRVVWQGQYCRWLAYRRHAVLTN